MSRIWKRLVSGVGLSNGCDGVRVEEAAAVRAELLDRFLRGDRPLRDRLRRAFQRLGHRVRMEILDDSLRAEDDRDDDGDRQEDVERGARQVDPEVADPIRFVPRESANERDGDRDARGRRHEVLHGERGHLDEVAHRRFAAVPLPVRVGHEAHGRVERLVRRDLTRAESLRVERQVPLQPHQQIGNEKREEAERENRAGVPRPRLLVVFAHAREPVGQHFERPHDRMEKRALALEEPRHEQPHRLREQQDDAEEHGDLDDADSGHDSLRIFPAGSSPSRDRSGAAATRFRK